VAASEERIAAAAPRGLREAAGRKKRTARAAAVLPHAVAPIGVPSAAAAGLYGKCEVIENRNAARGSVGFIKIK
jgi:hypothetical protein